MSLGWPHPAPHDPAAVVALIGEPAPTSEQAAVIGAAPGAALVIAGAGSGKTTTMAERVVWLVANGYAHPDEILGLTFTRKAARELRERIGRLLAALPPGLRGGEAADDLLDLATGATVSTYNAFAGGIHREHALAIGREPDAELIGEAAAWQLARRVVVASDVPGLAETDRTLSAIVSAVLDLAHALSDNAVDDPDAVAAYAAEFLRRRDPDVLPPGDRYERRAVVDEIEKLASLAVLLPLVAEFRAAKRRRGVMEFSDQVASALTIVQTSEVAATALRERYRFVLLDEYQDTSVVQTRLLRALFRERADDDGRRAIVAVGDPNQAIYGWRGASDANLDDFRRDFGLEPAAVPLHQLSVSWRNPLLVLAAANEVAEPLRRDAGVPVGELELRPDAPRGRVDIEIAETLEDEARAVAEWLAARLQEPVHKGGVDVAPTAAVLFRKRRHMGVFAAELARVGIPHRVLGVGGLLSTPEATDLVAGLRVLVDPDAGSALIRLLSGARWEIGLADLAALREVSRIVHHQRGAGPRDDGAAIVDGLDALVDAKEGWDALAAFTPEGLRRLRDAGEVFRALRSRLGLPLPELVRVVEEALRLDIEAAANDARPRATANLRGFRQQVEAFIRVDDLGTASAFLDWVDRAFAADERLAPAEEPAERGVVQLLTVHAAKGLEWDAVAVPRLVRDEFPDRPKEGKGWLAFGALPYEFRGDVDSLRRRGAWLEWESATTRKELKDRMDEFAAALRARHTAEERRLAYVAITRSGRDLLLTASHWPGWYDPAAKQHVAHPLSEYLIGPADAPGLLEGPVPASIHTEDPTDPHDGEIVWPLDPLGARRSQVEAAAAVVRAAIAGEDATAPGERWSRDLELLLAERARRTSPPPARPPSRIAASGFKAWIADPAEVAARVRRPMPEQPYRATRLGTIFHAWVEERYRDLLPEVLFDLDDDATDGEVPVGLSPADDAALARLKDAFERSEWADRRPLAIERAIELPFAGRTIPCKIDAVYERDGRIEIVDWKTGKAPGTAQERAAFDYQLALYRVAWSKATATTIELIDAKAFFVATGDVYAPERLPDEAELLERWSQSLQRIGTEPN